MGARMKNPPTLADACIATALDKRFGHGRTRAAIEHCAVLKSVASARKFVLDIAMSKYLAELSVVFWRGGLRKRNRMLDNVRQQARLPHQLTWIEIDFTNGYMVRSKELGSLRVIDIHGNEPARFGWLLRQHPTVESSFICTEIRSATNELYKDRVFTHPVAMAWSSTDDPIAFRRFGPMDITSTVDGSNSEFVTGIEGYRSHQVYWSSAFESDDAAADYLRSMQPPPHERYEGWENYIFPRLPIRDVWALLATINDLPIKIEHIEPSKGYVARGSYKKFLKHSVLHLTVPETRFRKLVLKTAAILRRRAHQVRGHWRVDWRNRPVKTCEHEWNAEMICRKCSGHKLWIAEHQRGDASIGFVTHDYEVHHDEASA